MEEKDLFIHLMECHPEKRAEALRILTQQAQPAEVPEKRYPMPLPK